MSPALDQVTAWIRTRHPEVGPIGPADDLIESRLIDSMGFIEFVGLLERLTAGPIDIEAVGIDSFRSLASIEHRFFAP